MEYFDITLPLSEELITYPGNQPFERTLLKTLENDDAQLSKLVMGTHSGTHVDAPCHFVKGGKSIDQIDLSRINGTAKVIDCTYVSSVIKQADIADLAINPGDRLLFKTRNSDYLAEAQFQPGFVAISLEAAQYLVNKEIVAVGIDYLSIEAKGSPGHPVHKAFLKHNVVILEGLNLQDIAPGEYQLRCLPLKITGADGAPCRAVLTR